MQLSPILDHLYIPPLYDYHPFAPYLGWMWNYTILRYKRAGERPAIVLICIPSPCRYEKFISDRKKITLLFFRLTVFRLGTLKQFINEKK